MQVIINKNNLIIWCLFFLALTSSFDIFMNITIAGFSIRLFYLIEITLILYIFGQILSDKLKSIKLVAGNYLFIWMIFIIVFVPNTTVLSRSIGYALWLILSIGIVIVFSTLSNLQSFPKIFKMYIYSFVLIGLFGLLQFFLGILGIDIYIQQWWIPGILPRINGLTYEPSFFGSYLLIGWSLLLYLYFKDKYYFSNYKYSFLIISLSIVLSSSRMAILMMVVGFLILIIQSIFSRLKKLYIKKRDLKILTLIVLIIFSLTIYIIQNFELFKFLFHGLGLFGTSAYSSETRTNEALDTFQIFWNSPFVGYSLGGVAPAIADLRGVTIHTQLEAKDFEGMNIFLEVLAASGAIGYIFFILFFIILYYKAFKVMKQLRRISNRHYLLIGSLSFALFMELFILSMNQSILRPYLWVLIGIFSASVLIGKEMIYEYKLNNRL